MNISITLEAQNKPFDRNLGSLEAQIVTSMPMDMVQWEYLNDMELLLKGDMTLIVFIVNKLGLKGMSVTVRNNIEVCTL